MTGILGKSVATAEQMANYVLSVNPNPKLSLPVLQLAKLYLIAGEIEGVRGDLEFARSCHETGNFAFKGTVTPDQKNFCGHGTVSATVKGSCFPDEFYGVLVQIQHAKAYATADPLNYDCIDDRYELVALGCAPTMEETSGKWAVPGYDAKKYASLEEANKAKDSYGHKIVKIFNKILTMPAEMEAVPEQDETEQEEVLVGGNSPLVDYVCISPNSTNPRNDKIRKITIHHVAGDPTLVELGKSFANPAREASSNYAIDSDGNVAMYVEEKNRAWTSGSRDNDNQAVTIEVANDEIGGQWHVSDKALAKLILLCEDICRRNGIERPNFTGNANGNLTMHKWFQATECPGPYLESKFPYIAAEVNKLLGREDAPVSEVPYFIRVANVSAGSVLNVRKGPGTDTQKVDELAWNDPNKYTIVEEKNGWGRLRSGIGWINLKYTVKV